MSLTVVCPPSLVQGGDGFVPHVRIKSESCVGMIEFVGVRGDILLLACPRTFAATILLACMPSHAVHALARTASLALKRAVHALACLAQARRLACL